MRNRRKIDMEKDFFIETENILAEVFMEEKKVIKKEKELLLKGINPYGPNDLFFEITIPKGLNNIQERLFLEEIMKLIIKKHKDKIKSDTVIRTGIIREK